ncbi:MAG: SRPBCC family protein [Faecalibacterium sp.]
MKAFENDIHKVWDIVFAVDKYSSWRSDLSKTEIINEKQFIEYTKDGYATTFSITAVEPYRRWEFDMENSNMAGHWIGVFMAKGNKTQVDFTENVIPKKWFATVYKGNIIKNLIMDCQSYTKYRPNETTGGIFVSWRRKEELPTGA